MVKVVNISSMTVEIAGVLIKPHKIHIFETLSDANRARVTAMSAVGIIRAYDYSKAEEPVKQEEVVQDNKDVVEEEKPTRKSNRKK